MDDKFDIWVICVVEKLGVSLSSPFSRNSGPVHGRLLEHYHEKSTLFSDVADK